MPRSEHLADMTTPGLHDEREACLLLTTDDYADRISDEIDSRDNT